MLCKYGMGGLCVFWVAYTVISAVLIGAVVIVISCVLMLRDRLKREILLYSLEEKMIWIAYLGRLKSFDSVI